MRSRITTVLTVLGAITVLVLAGNTVALATSGRGLIVGGSNHEKTATTISRTTPGSALHVVTKRRSDAPFVVNGSGKVVHLNADLVDGKDSSALGTHALVWTGSGTGVTSKEIDITTGKVPAGSYLVGYQTFLDTGSYPSEAAMDCYVRRNDENVYTAESMTTGNGWGTGVSGTGLVTFRTPGTLTLTCQTNNPATWEFADSEPLRITATPVTIQAGPQLPPSPVRVGPGSARKR